LRSPLLATLFSGAFCSVPYRPSLVESFFPLLAAVPAVRIPSDFGARAVSASSNQFGRETLQQHPGRYHHREPSTRTTPSDDGTVYVLRSLILLLLLLLLLLIILLPLQFRTVYQILSLVIVDRAMYTRFFCH
jgi:hypothetical protein